MRLGNQPVFQWLKTAVYRQWPLYGLLHLALRLRPVLTETKPFYLSICTIFKNEAPFLREWLTYHRLVGVDHFYLYNNQSTDDYQAVLQPFIDAGQVTLIDWPLHPGQVQAYQHCLDHYGQQSHWIATVDCDEFWVPVTDNSLPPLLKPFERYPMLAFYWTLFGSSGQLAAQPDQLVTEQYTVCDPTNTSFKTVYNTAFDNRVKNSHLGVWRWGWFSIKPLLPDGAFAPQCPTPRRKGVAPAIQINHYWSKSYADFCHKRGKGLPSRMGQRDMAEFFGHDLTCTQADYRIFRFMSLLKLELAKQSEAAATVPKAAATCVAIIAMAIAVDWLGTGFFVGDSWGLWARC